MVEETDKQPEEIKKPERADFLKEARELTERQEAAAKKMEELTQRNEELAARSLLGGKSESPQPEEKKEETPAEYAQRISQGKLDG